MFQDGQQVRFVVARRVLWWPIVLGVRLGIKRIAAARLHQALPPRSPNAAFLEFQETAACGRICDFNDMTSLTHFETAKHSRQELSLIQGRTKEFPPQCLRISCVTCFSTGYLTNSTARLQPFCRLARAQRPNPPRRSSSCALYIIFITNAARPSRVMALPQVHQRLSSEYWTPCIAPFMRGGSVRAGSLELSSPLG